MIDLRPYQLAFLRRFAVQPSKRMLLAWVASAGKTLGFIAAAQQLKAKRILIACPAMARGTWLSEFAKWAPEYDPRSIRVGKARISGVTKAARAYRDEAYAAEVQIVSYGLLRDLDPRRYDLIGLDEVHALREPLSVQSKRVRDLFKINTGTPALGLSATLIPTDPKQLWGPLHTFWPGEWGPAQATGQVSWKFMAQYCAKQINEYGTAYKGAKSDEAMRLLSERLEPYVHKVSDSEVAPYLPPLHAEALRLDSAQEPVSIATEWVETLAPGARPIIICFKRDTAHALGACLGARVISGEDSPESRLRQLAEPGLIIATSESIKESISLSVYTNALIFEWRTSPGQAIQLLRRFARQDAADLTRPTYVQYVMLPGDEARADVLTERIAVVNKVLQKDMRAEALGELFKPGELTEEAIAQMFMAAIGRIYTVDTEHVEEAEV